MNSYFKGFTSLREIEVFRKHAAPGSATDYTVANQRKKVINMFLPVSGTFAHCVFLQNILRKLRFVSSFKFDILCGSAEEITLLHSMCGEIIASKFKALLHIELSINTTVASITSIIYRLNKDLRVWRYKKMKLSFNLLSLMFQLFGMSFLLIK